MPGWNLAPAIWDTGRPLMTAPAPVAPALRCEISTSTSAQASTLAQIVSACARDVAQPVAVETRRARSARTAVLTLHLPAALAATQHPVWCLACRLACFCPGARVSVLVECESAFTSPRARRTRAA